MKISVKKKAITTTALISMTDVVFLLLIFIIITSNFVSYTGIPINIPVADNVHTDFQRNLSLSINEREELFLNDIRIAPEQLVDKLRIEIDNNPDVVVMIQADQNIALRRVVELIDAAKTAGTSRFFIAAQLNR